MSLEQEATAVSSATDTGLSILGHALELLPGLVPIIVRGLEGSEPGDPLADRVRKILPAEGASAAALRDLERGRP